MAEINPSERQAAKCSTVWRKTEEGKGSYIFLSVAPNFRTPEYSLQTIIWALKAKLPEGTG